MAKESISLSVAPSEEQETIELYQIFGWELQSSQEIFNQSSHLERSGESINNVTTTTNYVKLIFNRDKTIPHYAKLVELEQRYHAVRIPIKKNTIGFLILGVITLGFCVALHSGGYVGVTTICTLATLLFFILHFIKLKKNKKNYENAYTAAVNERREILQQAESL